MRESRLFLIFLRTNLILIAIPAVVLSAAFFVYQLNQPAVYYKSVLLEMSLGNLSVAEASIITDQAVVRLRAINLKKEIGVSDENRGVVFKASPLTINAGVEGKNNLLVDRDLKNLEGYAVKNFPLYRIGDLTSSEKKLSENFFALVGLLAGVFLGILLSLIKNYLQNY